MSKSTTGTMFLPTLAAVMLFDHEIQGQMSDGNWENTAPFDHWKFWCDLDVRLDTVGVPRVVTDKPWLCKKTGYNLAALYEYVGDRMLQIGRMGRAAQTMGYTGAVARGPAEYMPSTLAEFKVKMESRKWGEDYVREYMEQNMTVLLATVYYDTKYEMKDLRKDVALVKAAIKTMRQHPGTVLR